VPPQRRYCKVLPWYIEFVPNVNYTVPGLCLRRTCLRGVLLQQGCDQCASRDAHN